MADEQKTGPGVPEARSYVPVPDPTVLTTEALKREIASSRELIEIRVTGIRDTQEAKISGVMANIALNFTQ